MDKQIIVKKLESRIPNEYAVRYFGKWEARTYDDKKFAEAVIRECIKIVEES